MSLTIRSLKGDTKITWVSEDQATEASWTIKKDMTEEQGWKILTKATVFIGKQLGMMPETMAGPMGGTGSASAPAAPIPTGSTQPSQRVQMMNPASLPDRPSDGGPPTGAMDQTFWGSMPTAEVPGHLAASEHAWEMDPDSTGGW